MGWTVLIGQGGTIRTQDRIIDIRVTERFAHMEFAVTIQNPTDTDRAQVMGRKDEAIIQIKRGDDILIEGFIEDVEKEHNIIRYIGRSFLVLMGYTTSAETDPNTDATKAEYSGETGAYIIDDLMDEFCYPNDNELTYTDITFTETYGGDVKLHGRKVYDIVKNMCTDHSKDLWSDATWNVDGVNVDNKNIHVGTKSRGSAVSPHMTLYGGIHLKNIPSVKYRVSHNVINRIRINGKGSGKEKISVLVDPDDGGASQATYGIIEGSPYNNNMIVDEATATTVGQAIIAAKKDLVEELQIELIQYIADLKYGDWVQIIDPYSFVDTTQRIKKITRSYNNQSGESVNIEIGMPFDNYETLIRDLTKGDVDEEIEMVKQGGSLRLTANEDPDDFVRIDPGEWYDTTGTFQEKGKGVVPFWTYADNPATGSFMKALIQISNAGAVSYKVGTQQTTALLAEGTTVSVDALNIPLGEVILKGKAVGGGGYTVEDVYSDDQGKSYIFRDVRPIIGSSSAGYGGLWEVSGSPQYTQLITAQNVYLQGYDLRDVNVVKGVLGSDFSLYGSNYTHDGFIEALKWDHDQHILSTSSITFILDEDNTDPGVNTSYRFGRGSTAGDAAIVWDETDDKFEFAAVAGSIFAPISVGYLELSSEPSHKSGDIQIDNTSGDMEFTDSVTGTKTLADLAGVVGLWEDMGTYAQLIDPDDIELQGNGILGVSSIKSEYTAGVTIHDSNGATKGYLGTTGYLLSATSHIDMNNWDILDIDDITFHGTGSVIDMNGGDIIDVDEIKGTTSTACHLDFRGDNNHRIWYDGPTLNKMKYDTYLEHILSIQGTMIAAINTNGLIMNAGMYIKSFSGDLELRAPSGSKVKFVIG